MHHADFVGWERKSLETYCKSFMFVLVKTVRNLGHRIRMEEFPNQEITQILNFLVDLRLDEI